MRLPIELGRSHRRVVDLVFRKVPVTQAKHAVGHARDGGVVGHGDERATILTVHTLHELEDLLGSLVIERAGGLVEQNEAGVLHERKPDGTALLLSARDLARELVPLLPKTKRAQQLVHRERALREMRRHLDHICQLYTLGESSSVSQQEGYELAESTLYVLGFFGKDPSAAIHVLKSDDVIAAWTKRRKELDARIPKVMELWREVVMTMPSLNNIALRDTLVSIETLSNRYDTFFGAHEIPCNIDYPLSVPISEELKGLDYNEAWLNQLLREASYLVRYDTDDMIEYLEAWCPDYQGLLINLYEPIHEGFADSRYRSGAC